MFFKMVFVNVCVCQYGLYLCEGCRLCVWLLADNLLVDLETFTMNN